MVADIHRHITGTNCVSSAEALDDYFDLTSTRICFSCTLIQSIRDEHDHYQGPLGCADPFDDNGIPQVQCDGECGVSSHIGQRAAFISRFCAIVVTNVVYVIYNFEKKNGLSGIIYAEKVVYLFLFLNYFFSKLTKLSIILFSNSD